MKKTLKQSKRSNPGYALLITMVFIGIALLLLGSVMDWTNSSAKQTERNNLFNMSTAAAEADTERVIAQMSRDFWKQALSVNSNYYLIYIAPSNQVGWPCQFSFSDGFGTNNQTHVSIPSYDWKTNWVIITNVINPTYSNHPGCVASCTVISTATTANQSYNVSATVEQDFQFVSFPLFAGMAFYNLNMEIDPGATMTFNGPVFCNQNIWTCGQAAFNSSISAAGTVYYTTTNDPFMTGKHDPSATSFASTPSSGVPSEVMAIGTNTDPTAVRAFLELPPASVTLPYSQDGQLYFYNEADIVISNSPSGTNNISAYFQDNGLTFISPDLIITNGSGTNKTYTTNYSFATNVTFYDYREGKTVKAVQLNVGALNSWINGANGSVDNNNSYNDKGHYIDSVYVYNNATASSTTLPAVRVANGATLPSQGLTVMTPDPLYVLGSYNLNGGTDTTPGLTNTANTSPAAFIGDSITVLSQNWKDTYNVNTNLSSRSPTNTTINAATFQGIVQSTNSNYSGGVENFLRLLENWNNSSTTLTYNGSIAVMFPSHYATNFWSGSYYGTPIRRWAFDLNFTQQNRLPSCTPQYKVFIPGQWKVY